MKHERAPRPTTTPRTPTRPATPPRTKMPRRTTSPRTPTSRTAPRRTTTRRGTTTVEKGAIGERIAFHYLCENGYQVVKKNLRCCYGEVDIIAIRHAKIYFIEVKAWRTLSYEDVGIAIDARKRRRIIMSARYFLQTERRFRSHAPRFALLFVDMTTGACRYVGAAFEEEHRWRV